MSEKFVFAKDMEAEPYSGMFDRIKENNNSLYMHIVTGLENGGSAGINADVLSYFAENAENIAKDEQFLFHLVNFSCNSRITVEHIKFVIDYFYNSFVEDKFALDDFSVIFLPCVEKRIPTKEIRELFTSGKDVVEIYEAVDQYITNTEQSDTHMEAEVLEEENDKTVVNLPDQVEDKEINSPSDVDMFNNLVSIMSYQEKDDMEVLNNFQRDFTGLLDRMQGISANMSTFSSEVLNSIKKDKEEIKRLNAMITLMKNLLSSKQVEIDHLRGEIMHLNDRIQASEMAELRRDALNNKIMETYKLAFNNDLMS